MRRDTRFRIGSRVVMNPLRDLKFADATPEQFKDCWEGGYVKGTPKLSGTAVREIPDYGGKLGTRNNKDGWFDGFRINRFFRVPTDPAPPSEVGS